MLYSQNQETCTAKSAIKLDTILKLESFGSLKTSFMKKKDSFSFFKSTNSDSVDFTTFNFSNQELKKQLIIPQITFVENTFTDYTDYIRGCGPLEDGITKTVNSRDIMLSNIFDNFINNIVFKGGGPLNMIFHPEN
jgi:hypothetical protein